MIVEGKGRGQCLWVRRKWGMGRDQVIDPGREVMEGERGMHCEGTLCDMDFLLLVTSMAWCLVRTKIADAYCPPASARVPHIMQRHRSK